MYTLDDLQVYIDVYDTYLGIKYVSFIAAEVINGKINPIDAVTELNRYNETMFYDGHFVYNTYGELSDNIDLLHDCGISIIPGMNKNNIEEYIKHHFVLFLKTQNMKMPDNIYEQAYCQKCNRRIFPRLKKSFFGRCYEWKCPECKHNRFNWIKYNDGMDLFLREKGIDRFSEILLNGYKE